MFTLEGHMLTVKKKKREETFVLSETRRVASHPHQVWRGVALKFFSYKLPCCKAIDMVAKALRVKFSFLQSKTCCVFLDVRTSTLTTVAIC